MSIVDVIIQALMSQGGYVPLEETDIDTSLIPGRNWYKFIGVRGYWGSIITCAILEQQGEDQEFIARRLSEFYEFSSSLKGRAATIWLTKLGCFGLLAVVIPGPATEVFRKAVAKLKRGSAWRKDHCVVWLLDQSRGEVFVHRGYPLTCFPGRSFFRDFLRRAEPGQAARSHLSQGN